MTQYLKEKRQSGIVLTFLKFKGRNAVKLKVRRVNLIMIHVHFFDNMTYGYQ